MSNQLQIVLEKFETTIPQAMAVNEAVSKGSVGWHIEHSLITLNLILETLKKSNPKYYNWSFNFKRMVVYALNKIPRGKGKAPKAVQPAREFTVESLQERLRETIANIESIASLNPNAYFKHPYFGKLNLKSTFKFLVMHTEHHQKIIKDILNSK
jgi:DinB superfamily